MKKLFCCFAMIAACSLSAQTQGDPPLRFDVVEWDFGEIKEDGGTVSHEFEFTNHGDHPIAIDRVVTSCGCTTPEYSRGTIAPGERGRVAVSFDPAGFVGPTSKTITVASGGGKYREYLIIKAVITPRVRSTEEAYPYDMGGGLRMDATVVAFRTVAQGRSAAMAVGYVNTSEQNITLALEPVEESGMLDVFAPETICAGCEGTITLTYDLSSRERYGVMHDVLAVIVGGVPSDKTLYAATTGIDNFSKVNMDTAPKFFLDSQSHDFGELKSRAVPYTFRLVASNEGKSELHIRSVSEKDGLRSTLKGGTTIAPGEKLPFELMFYSNKYSDGPLHESIMVVVDDPMRPVREIRISANIK